MQKVYMRQKNDCYTACLATIFRLPYEDVPRFFDDPEAVTAQNFNEKVDQWLGTKGLGRICIGVDPEWVRTQAKGAVLVSGLSPNPVMAKAGTFHCVVYLNGVLFHDPNPYPEGEVTPTQMDIIYPLLWEKL